MPFTQFPEFTWIRTIDTNEQVDLATITPSRTMELIHIRPLIYRQGSATANLQLTLHTSTNYNVTYASSNTVASSTWGSGTNYLGWIRFDFNREVLRANQTYYLTMKTSSYTGTSSVFFALTFDSPNTNNTIGSAQTVHHISEHPYKFELYGSD